MSTAEIRRALMLREMGIVQWQSRAQAPVAAEGAREAASPVIANEVAQAQCAQAEPDAPATEANRATDESVPARNARIATLDWEAIEHEVSGCTACGLCATRKQTVFGVGARTARWMLVGEAPGAEEDARGEPFVGQAGRLLDAMLSANGLKRSADVFIANVLKCRPPGNRDPQPAEVAACEPYLLRQLELVDPDIVVVLGRFAAQSLLASDASIARMRGQVHSIEVGGRRVPVIVTYHPAYLLRTLSDKAKAWADWCLAAQTLARATT